jgi:hypothetical protein
LSRQTDATLRWHREPDRRRRYAGHRRYDAAEHGEADVHS